MCRSAFFAVALAATIGSAAAAGAELPDNYLKRWDDPAVQKRIEEGIERNRKSDVLLHIVNPAGHHRTVWSRSARNTG